MTTATISSAAWALTDRAAPFTPRRGGVEVTRRTYHKEYGTMLSQNSLSAVEAFHNQALGKLRNRKPVLRLLISLVTKDPVAVREALRATVHEATRSNEHYLMEEGMRLIKQVELEAGLWEYDEESDSSDSIGSCNATPRRAE